MNYTVLNVGLAETPSCVVFETVLEFEWHFKLYTHLCDFALE